MSYYYNYYIGYKKDGKIYPLGPYDCFGHLHSVLSRSSSFSSNLHYEFSPVQENEVSEELRKEFEETRLNGDKIVNVKWCPLDDLPSDSYIKKGYFLIKDVQEYERTNNSEDLFYDYLSPTVYAAMSTNERIYGKPTPQEDEECTHNSAADYMYYAYPDYRSKEYEAFVLRLEAEDYEYVFNNNDASIVILLWEG